MRFSQVLSGWILVTVSVDRWIRTRFPFKSNVLCTPRNALITVAVIVVIDTGLYSHFLSSFYGMLIPGFAILSCGPSIYSVSYFIFFFMDWSIVEVYNENERIRKTSDMKPFCFFDLDCCHLFDAGWYHGYYFD